MTHAFLAGWCILRRLSVYSMVDEPSYALKLCPPPKKKIDFLDFVYFFLLHAKN